MPEKSAFEPAAKELERIFTEESIKAMMKLEKEMSEESVGRLKKILDTQVQIEKVNRILRGDRHWRSNHPLLYVLIGDRGEITSFQGMTDLASLQSIENIINDAYRKFEDRL